MPDASAQTRKTKVVLEAVLQNQAGCMLGSMQGNAMITTAAYSKTTQHTNYALSHSWRQQPVSGQVSRLKSREYMNKRQSQQLVQQL